MVYGEGDYEMRRVEGLGYEGLLGCEEQLKRLDISTVMVHTGLGCITIGLIFWDLPS